MNSLNPPATHIHLLFQSLGGSVGDGICLYNFFQALTIDLTLYNVGAVQSIATIAYLGAKKRKTSAYAVFGLHRTHSSPQFATASRLQAATELMTIDDKRTEAILRKHLRLTDKHWSQLNLIELALTGEEAVSVGLADEVAEFSPPKGAKIYAL